MKGSKKKRTPAAKNAAAKAVVVAEDFVQPEVAQEAAVEPVRAEVAIVADAAIADATPAGAPSAATVTLQANCSVREVIGLRSLLLEVIESATAVIVDVAQLERIDTAALQVLAAFVRDRRNQQREVIWVNVNEALSEAARTLGLFAALGIADERAEAA